jgi:ribonuclease PH
MNACDCDYRVDLRVSMQEGARGSSYVECGNSKVLCVARGPLPHKSSQFVNEGLLQVSVRRGSFSTEGKRLHKDTARVMEEAWALFLHQSFKGCLQLEQFPKSEIRIECFIVEEDGSMIPSLVHAVSLALADAKFPMRGLVTCCEVACVRPSDGGKHPTNGSTDLDGRLGLSEEVDDGGADADVEALVLVADPSTRELRFALGTMTLALIAIHGEIVQCVESGHLSGKLTKEAMNWCRDGCITMHKNMRKVLISELE